MFISGPQIRAARGLLDWSVTELGAKVGIAPTTVSAIERGRIAGSKEVLTRILLAFQSGGVELTAEGGVAPKRIATYTLPSYLDLLDQISSEMPEGGEILKHCVDDRRSSPEVVAKVAEMRAQGITERLTVSEENPYISREPELYRTVPSDYFASSEVTIIYGDKVAFFVDGSVLVIVSTYLNRVFRAQFEYWWKHGGIINAQ